MHLRGKRLGIALLVTFASACSGSGVSTIKTGGPDASAGHGCVPNQELECPCSGGKAGVQICSPTGDSYGPCVCLGASNSKGETNGSGTSGTADTSGSHHTSDQSSHGGTSSSGGGGKKDGGGGGGGCPAGAKCDQKCDGGAETTVSGTVYDPSGKNPIYNALVYIPSSPVTPLARGVPTGADMCSCKSIVPADLVTSMPTGVDGTFSLKNVPVGDDIQLVAQVGKWRRVMKIKVEACKDNKQPDGSLSFPGTIANGDTDDNMPDIAVSTGSADTLECLLSRMGVADLEYVPGSSTAGHVHIFAGGDPSGGAHGGGGAVGIPEKTPLAGAPESFDATAGLWASAGQLMPYDVVMLSCEGGETYDANPTALEAYLTAGGRVLASHYHYAWFAGPLESSSTQSYTVPSTWGDNLATWSGGMTGVQATDIGAVIETKLNPSGAPFPEGVALSTWLSDRGAIGTNGVATGELAVFQPRYNAVVTTSNTQSQPWLTSDSASADPGSTLQFSFDTPVAAAGGTPGHCGRAFYSDLHVSGDDTAPLVADNANLPPPMSCAMQALSPQEKALEFTLFDLSGCLQ
jgi:hypothetical protein